MNTNVLPASARAAERRGTEVRTRRDKEDIEICLQKYEATAATWMLDVGDDELDARDDDDRGCRGRTGLERKETWNEDT